MARYLVTGGAGFIGSHIVERLVGLGESVVVLDNLSTGTLSNLAPWLESVTFVQGDIRHLPMVREACVGADYVLHQAALPSVPRSVKDPIASNDANVNGTLNVLVAARDAGVRRVVYAGSSSAYGDTPTLPKREDMPARPLSPYAISKYTGELYCQVFATLYGLETVVLRYFNVFGPRQDPTSDYAAVIPKFIMALQQGTRPVIYGDGEQSRDFTYIANVVEANLLACQAQGAAGEVINIACGKRTSLNQLMRVLGRIAHSHLEAVHGKARAGDVKDSLADVAKAHRLLGYSPAVSLEEGLALTSEYYARLSAQRAPCPPSAGLSAGSAGRCVGVKPR